MVVNVVQESKDEYGNCDGPNAQYIKLISSDGHEFIIKREYALLSGTIRAMLNGSSQLAENETIKIHFCETPSHVLRKVCTFLMYKSHYSKHPTLIEEFTIESDIALELLLAANFLDC